MNAPILIVGYGNPLMGDDGAGPAVLERLAELHPPEWVRLENGHTDSLTLRESWRGESEVWFIDALCSGPSAARDGSEGPPKVGTVREISNDELLAVPQMHATAHALSLPESLRWLRLAYPELETVRFRLWGIEIEHAHLGQRLSDPVARGVEEAAQAIARVWGATEVTPKGRAQSP